MDNISNRIDNNSNSMVEEAKRLVDRFKIMGGVLFYEDSVPAIARGNIVHETAKQCAIICCEEISETHIGAEYHIYYKRLIEEIKKL